MGGEGTGSEREISSSNTLARESLRVENHIKSDCYDAFLGADVERGADVLLGSTLAGEVRHVQKSDGASGRKGRRTLSLQKTA